MYAKDQNGTWHLCRGCEDFPAEGEIVEEKKHLNKEEVDFCDKCEEKIGKNCIPYTPVSRGK